VEPLTTGVVAWEAGVERYLLERWVRAGIIAPAHPGKPNTWEPSQIRLVRLVRDLREFYAPYRSCAASVRSASDLPEGAWKDTLIFDKEGRITKPLWGRNNGWLIRMARCDNPEWDKRILYQGEGQLVPAA
jgi:hypothetical protein